MHVRSILLAATALLALPAVSQAQALPAPVEAMIRNAAQTSDDALNAVAAAARATNPDAVAQIDALVAQLQADKAAAAEAALARAGWLDNWTGEGQLGLSRTTGNTDDTGFLVAVNLARDGLHTRQQIAAALDRQKTAGALTRERYLANYQLDYKFTDRLYAFGLLGWERDTFAGFTRRFTESFGVGYRVLTGDRMWLDVEAGPAFRQTRLVGGGSDNQTTARGSLAYRWQMLDNLVFTQDASVFLGSGNRTLTSSTAFSAAITGALSSRLSYDGTQESDPPAGRKKTDTATRFSLVYGF